MFKMTFKDEISNALRESRFLIADVFCICLLTNKYQKYKSVELGDQLGFWLRSFTIREADWKCYRLAGHRWADYPLGYVVKT